MKVRFLLGVLFNCLNPMTYKELLDKLDTLPLDSPEYKEIRKKILEIDFREELAQEFGKMAFDTIEE